MQIPLQISFRHVYRSQAVVDKIRERVEHLEYLCQSIMSCRIVVELANHRHRQGNIFQVRIDLKMPRSEIAISGDPAISQAHEDVYVAVRDAFNAAERRLQEYVHRTRVRVHLKHREQSAHGRVARILRGDGDYGFLTTPQGREIYFHKNSVLNDRFDSLHVGSVVRFVEELGDEGPQASTVAVVR